MAERKSVDEVLASFPESAITSRLLTVLFGAIPGAPAFDARLRVEHFVRTMNPAASEAQIARALEIARTDPVIGDILWMGRLMDQGDKGIAAMGGLMNAFRAFTGATTGADTLETDSQQRNDAVLKAIGLAYLTYKAFPGTVAEKAAALQASEAGKMLMLYYGAIEVALPFADNLLQAGADGVTRMIQGQAASQTQRLQALAAGHDLGGAAEMLTAVTSQLQGATAVASQYVAPITAQIGPMLPGLMSAADKAAGAMATAADLLDTYTVLAARLAAEVAARKALEIVRPTPSAQLA